MASSATTSGSALTMDESSKEGLHESSSTGRSGGRGPEGRPRGFEGGFLDRYKPEQGARVRGVSLAAGLLLAFGAAQFVYRYVAVIRDPARVWTQIIALGLPLAVGGGLGLLAYWLTYSRRSTSDFLIATEGELRKVSWSSRREVWGSTKVVIVITLIFAVLTGLVDLIFFKAFQVMGVLKEGVTGLGEPGG